MVKGNLITLAQQGAFDIIVHGCNCFNTMGAGIAPQIAEAFPEAWKADQMTVSGDRNKLGNITIGVHQIEYDFFSSPVFVKGMLVVNGYTQFGTANKPGECVVDYLALRNVFKRVAVLANSASVPMSIGYPAIGAGLAGGDWTVIRRIIQEELDNCNHTYVEFDE